MRYTILGATGQVGGATARALLNEGASVRVVMRRADAVPIWQRLGAETAVADLSDARALTRAVTGSDAVFVATPPYFDVADMFAANSSMIRELTTAIRNAQVPHAVILSSIGAQHPRGLGAIATKHDLEQGFARLGMPFISLRAGWFMENYRGLIESARERGTIPSMLAPLDLEIPMVSTRDVGRVAAGLLQNEHGQTGVLELAFPRPYSSNDAARIMSAALGRNVEAFIVPPAERMNVYHSWGCTHSAAQAMSEMIDGFNSGWIAFAGGAARRVDAPTSLDRALRDAAAALAAA